MKSLKSLHFYTYSKYIGRDMSSNQLILLYFVLFFTSMLYNYFNILCDLKNPINVASG
jgi:hypothetical protein